MRETLRSARRSAAIAPPLSTYRNTGWPAGDCPRPPSARGRHKRCASDRRARRSQPRRPASPGRCEHNPNALVHDLNEAAAVALLPPVEPDELRAAKRGRPALPRRVHRWCEPGPGLSPACGAARPSMGQPCAAHLAWPWSCSSPASSRRSPGAPRSKGWRAVRCASAIAER